MNNHQPQASWKEVQASREQSERAARQRLDFEQVPGIKNQN